MNNKILFLFIFLLAAISTVEADLDRCIFYDQSLCGQEIDVKLLNYSDWEKVNLTELYPEEIKHIPLDLYDYKKINENYLKNSSFEQTNKYFLNYTNLQLLNKEDIKEIFLDKYQINLNYTNDTSFSFNGTHVNTDFYEYDATNFSSFHQVLDNNSLKITGKGHSKELKISNFKSLSQKNFYIQIDFEDYFINLINFSKAEFNSSSEFSCVECSQEIFTTNVTNSNNKIPAYLEGDYVYTKEILELIHNNYPSSYIDEYNNLVVSTKDRNIDIGFGTERKDVLINGDEVHVNNSAYLIYENRFIGSEDNADINLSRYELKGTGTFEYEDSVILHTNNDSTFRARIDSINKYYIGTNQNLTLKYNSMNTSSDKAFDSGFAFDIINEEDNYFDLKDIQNLKKATKGPDLHLLEAQPSIILLDNANMTINEDWSLEFSSSSTHINIDSLRTPEYDFNETKSLFIEFVDSMSLSDQQEFLQDLFLLKFDETDGTTAISEIVRLLDTLYEGSEKNAMKNWAILYFSDLYPVIECTEQTSYICVTDLFYDNAIEDFLESNNYLSSLSKILSESETDKLTITELAELEFKNIILNYINAKNKKVIDSATRNNNVEFTDFQNMNSVEGNAALPDDLIELMHERMREDVRLAYKGLLYLDMIEPVQGGIRVNWNSFSSNKYELVKGLTQIQLEDEKYGSSFDAIDTIQEEYLVFLDELETDRDTEKALHRLDEDISEVRRGISSEAFQKINLNLLYLEEQLDLLTKAREGYVQSVTNKDVFDNTFASILLSGGFGKDLLWALGVFDDFQKAVNELDSEAENAKGLFILESLVQQNMSGEQIKDWIDSDDGVLSSVNLVVDEFGKDDVIYRLPENLELAQDLEGHLDNLKIGQEKAVQLVQMLDRLKPFARDVYYNSEYSNDLPRIIGYERNIDSEYKGKPLDIDDEKVLEKYKSEIANLEFNGIERVLNYIDEGFSPATFALMVGTGGVGFTATGASGARGIAVSASEFLVVDAATGTVLVAADMEDNIAAQLGTSLTSNVALVSAMRSFSRTARTGAQAILAPSSMRTTSQIFDIDISAINRFVQTGDARPGTILRNFDDDGTTEYLRVLERDNHLEDHLILLDETGDTVLLPISKLKIAQPNFEDVYTLNTLEELYIFAKDKGLTGEDALRNLVNEGIPIDDPRKLTRTYDLRYRYRDITENKNLYNPSSISGQSFAPRNLRILTDEEQIQSVSMIVAKNRLNRFKIYVERYVKNEFDEIKSNTPFKIRQDKIINFHHPSRQEAMVINFKSPLTSKFYNHFEKNARNSDFENYISLLYLQIRNNIMYDPPTTLPYFTEGMISRGRRINRYEEIGEACIEAGRGVCRHHGLLAASMTQKFRQEINPNIVSKVYYTVGGSHAFATFIHPSTKEKYILDVAQDYLGPAKVSGPYDSRIIFNEANRPIEEGHVLFNGASPEKAVRYYSYDDYNVKLEIDR